jgi:hypothetical protein
VADRHRVLIGWATAHGLQAVADQNKKVRHTTWPLNIRLEQTPRYCFPIYVENPPDGEE